MTIYAGETVQIKATAKDFDQSTALVGADLSSVVVTIYDAAGTALVTAAAMTYDADDGGWIYNWDTSAVAAGNYRAKVQASGPSSELSMEFARIRLNRRPIGG